MKDLDRILGTLFSDIARFRRILFDQLATEYELTHVQVFVLNQLHKQDGLTQTELSGRMDIGTVTVSGLVDRLEAKGYVERRADDKDRRAKRVWLTPKVKDIQKQISKSMLHLNEVTLHGMDEADIEQLVATLRKAKSNLQNRLNTGSLD